MKKFVIAILLVALLTGGLGFYGGYKYKESREKDDTIDLLLDDPNEVVIEWFDALKKGDANHAIRLFGIQTKSTHFDFERYIKRLQAINLRLIPTLSPFFSTMSISTMDYTTMQMHNFIIQLNLETEGQDLFSLGSIPLEGNEGLLDRIIEAYELNDMEDLSLKEIYQFDLGIESAEENNKKLAKIYGGENIIDLLIVFEYNDNSYGLGMSLLECEEGYFIHSLNSAILGTPVNGIPLSNDEVEDLLEDDDKFELIWED